jgi:hypothetical protein
MNRLWFTLVVALAAGALAAVPDGASGCAAAPHHGESVSTNDEAALIVWDEKTQTEHFVRRAHFHSTGYDFGFLVPTPNKPELDVADDNLFRELAQITAPKVEYREVVREVESEFQLGCSKAAKEASKAETAESMAVPGGVEVLAQKRVGDYDATVLAFRKGEGDTPEHGAAELAKWLAKHGYESPPAIEKWLKKYVDDQWCITAFKIAAPEPKAGSNASTRRDLMARPVRMSFKADRPFYPYREPETEPTAHPQGETRLLRVFLAAPGRFTGKLGDGSRPWPGQTVWSGSVDTKNWTSIFSQAKLAGPPLADVGALSQPKADAGWWLTEFEDRSAPRPGTDEVYFERAADQAPVERPIRIIDRTRTVEVTPWWHVAVYLGVPVVLVLTGLITWRMLRRE